MKKMLLALLLAAVVAALSLAGCNGADEDEVRVVIPHYKVGDNVGALYFLPIVDSFNERYEGRFHITIEPITQALYAEQLRLLAPAGMLPAAIEGGLDDVWFREVIIPGDMFVDLRPFFSQLPVYHYFNPDGFQHNLTEDGRLITVPHPIQRPMTMFYNEALWTPSRPIHDMTWREIAAELDGQNIAFMTAENSWTTMLVLSSLIAVEPGGLELVIDAVARQERIRDFNHPALISAFTELQYLMANHAQPAAIGAPFAEAANAFFNLNAAIIANGPWMIGSFGPGGEENWGSGFDPDTVRASVLPGNVALFNPIGNGWWIPSTPTPAEQELALHFLGYMFSMENLEFTMEMAGGVIPGFAYSEEFRRAREADRLMNEYADSLDENTIIMPAFWDAVYPSIADIDFGALLPLLIDGTLTPEEFAAELTQRTLDAN